MTVRPFKITLLSVLFITKSFSLFSQYEVINRFGLFEKEIKNSLKYENPYKDVQLVTTLTESFKKQHFIKGFYDGNETWKIRFSPGNPKTWICQYQFTDNTEFQEYIFKCSPRNNMQTIEVSPINHYWFKRATNPFYIKGDIVDWTVLTKLDTTNLLNLKETGVNLLFFENVENKGIELFPLNYKEYRKIEPSLKWIQNNGVVIVLPVNMFLANQKPSSREEWDDYLSYYFSRLGFFHNIMYYIPENHGAKIIPSYEKEQIVTAIINNNPYSNPFAILNNDDLKITNQYRQFALATDYTINSEESAKSLNIPLLAVVSETINTDSKKLIPYLCEMFTRGNNCIINSNLLSESSREQVKFLWGFLEELPYFDMKPCEGISNNGSCIGIKNDQYLLFIDNNKPVKLSLGNNYYQAKWINPYHANTVANANTVTGNTQLTPPSKNNEWLLHLSRDKSGLPMGIHLSWSQDPASTLTVTWTTYSQENPCIAQYRAYGSEKWLEQKGVSEKSPGEVWIHSAVLKELKADAKYEYRVSADNNLSNVFSPIYKTGTAPESEQGSFSFAFITDTGLKGRLDNNATGSGRIVKELIIEQPDFLLGGGDYAYANRDKRFKTKFDNINYWFAQYQPVLATTPFMAQYGNHELYLQEKFEDWAPFFKHPEGFRNSKHYSFDIGNVHFTSFCLVDKLPDEDELAWLEKDLAKAKAKNQWLIVYHHEPIYAFGTSHPSKPKITNRIYPILRKYEVDLDICGHDQSYERTYPLSGTDGENPQYKVSDKRIYKQGEGTVFAKVSPAGKKSEIGNIFPLFLDNQPPFIAVQDRSMHHFAVVNVKEGKSIEVKIYNVPEDESPKYLIDYFIITK